MTATKRITENDVRAAHLRWIRAADKGYGDRDYTISRMRKVDARIQRLRSRYFDTAKAYQRQQKEVA